MNWVDGLANAIIYIEQNIKEDLNMEVIASKGCVSNFYFQKAFSILCNMSVSEYIRCRRLSLAGSELIATDKKIIDLALEYGYESPDSFTKAFTRFHGVTPTVARKKGAMIKSFAPLKINFYLEGGTIMDYKIMEKEEFTIMGLSRNFDFKTSYTEIPRFWEGFKGIKDKAICGMYGFCVNEGAENSFKYMIADNYIPTNEVPEGYETHVVPKQTWAVFPCRGALPESLQKVNDAIFRDWLVNNGVYEINGNCNIEMYTPCSDYKLGMGADNYYSEIWVPVKKK